MNVLVISNGNRDYDGRLRELINIAKKVGKTIAISTGSEKNEYIYTKQSYLGFIIFCLKKCIKIKKVDVLIVDNRKAVVPSILIAKLLNIRYIVQDVRELYLINEVKHFTGKIGCIIESYLIKRADLILCANKYRARIMKKYYRLSELPIVFENYRMLSYSDDIRRKLYEERYKSIFSNEKFKLISTSGCSVFRTNNLLVEALPKCKVPIELYLVGKSEKCDQEFIKEIVENNNMKNVHIIDQVKEDELKYLISKCDAGVVNYCMEDSNNKFCASGKIYEFLFEGKPVVTTNNPPLKELCDLYQIGVSSDKYVEAIDEIVDNYDQYVENVKKFISNINIEENNKVVANKIKKGYKEKLARKV